MTPPRNNPPQCFRVRSATLLEGRLADFIDLMIRASLGPRSPSESPSA